MIFGDAVLLLNICIVLPSRGICGYGHRGREAAGGVRGAGGGNWSRESGSRTAPGEGGEACLPAINTGDK